MDRQKIKEEHDAYNKGVLNNSCTDREDHGGEKEDEAGSGGRHRDRRLRYSQLQICLV
jgi:hypothetical protein